MLSTKDQGGVTVAQIATYVVLGSRILFAIGLTEQKAGQFIHSISSSEAGECGEC